MKYLTLTAILAFIFLPDLASAAGFVQCEGVGPNACSACDLVAMGNTILKWLIGVMMVIFAVILVVAGLGLVTSGGNPAAKTAAKGKITNAIIGLVIVLAAWILVDTIMRSLLVGGNGQINGFLWSTVQCQTQTVSYLNPLDEPVETPALPSDTTCPSPLTTSHTLAGVSWSNTNLQKCVAKFTAEVGGTVTSSYRSPEYQSHLYEVSTKACQLSKTSASCTSVRAVIEGDRASHGLPLCGAVAKQNSTHSSGTGVDITGISHSSANVKAAASKNCLVWKNYPNDPFHYDLKAGCTCN